MQVPILLYHNLDEGASVVSLRPEQFAWQMRWLHERGYQAVRLSEIVRHLRHEGALPRKAVAITFDDGFESVYQIAASVLSRYGFSATVFLVPAFCSQTNTWPGQPRGVPSYPLMSWGQICELDRSGIEFGAHSVHHQRLDRLALEEATVEILDSKARIEDRLGHAVPHFAYPYGRYNAAVKAIVSQAFAGACAAWPGLVGTGSDPWELPRIDVLYVARTPLFRQMGSHFFGPYLVLRRSLRTLTSWLLRRQW
jgi:peptidoglycan/xylan/chitin deacetylase (PgdA/CDA1 family)